MYRTSTLTLILLLAAVSLACEKSDPFEVAGDGASLEAVADPANITVGAEDSDGTIYQSDISATLLDSRGLPKGGINVTFTTDTGKMKFGRLSTNSNGIARDTLSVDAGDIFDGDTAIVKVRSGNANDEAVINFGRLPENEPPDVSFGVVPNPQRTGLAVFFDATNTQDPEGDTNLTYQWTLSSSNPDNPANNPEIIVDTFPSFAKTFQNAQILTVQLAVTDTLGATGNATLSPNLQILANLPPIAEAGQNVNTTLVNGAASVFFDGSGSVDPDPGGRIVRYDWSFGDGGLAFNRSTPQTNHTYTAAGSYIVNLTVWDNGDQSTGCSSFLTPPCPGSLTDDDNLTVRVN